MKKPTYKELERKLLECEAQSATAARGALRLLPKAGDCLMASAVIVHLTALGGREIVPVFAIRDGLSAATLAALKADIERTMDLSKFSR